MRTLGVVLLVAGILSSALYFLHMNFMFLNWINTWGPDMAWMIRGGIIVLGIIFYFLGKRSD
ncbi:MAG: hypothetical protein IPP15_09215 [Saprospiraceae bacterium]|uniref:DUF378 domain-containing protein n=1 Tax=Candidatus Opimibacter skivensis TaxID=2982028 RepID=A0A9D7SUN2_9BACT|nr:hypothetical protein [Candidatus Opimibacter skivensis]